jgi:hypothetical protein
MFEHLFFLLVMSAIAEAAAKTADRVIRFVRNLIEKRDIEADVNKMVLLGICLAVTIFGHISIVDEIGQPVFGPEWSMGFFGYVLTGLLIGRGSNVFHSLIEKIKVWSSTVKAPTPPAS